jgi:hypothetical protein
VDAAINHRVTHFVRPTSHSYEQIDLRPLLE